MSIEIYESALAGRPADAEYDDGTREPLDTVRWLGPLDDADRALLDGVHGSVLDIGCGPGRLAAALRGAGVDALGLDIAPGALALARDRGAYVAYGSVFGPVPRAGEWQHALLADGNVGIGGDPGRLLARVRQLLAPGGRAHVELGARHQVVRARLRAQDGRVGTWFPWAFVSASGLESVATSAGLTLARVWEVGGRCFAELVS